MYMSHWETRDVRLDNWPLMSSLWPTLVLSASYLYFIYSHGPKMIKSRQAFEMKGFMNLYNLVQIYGSMYMFINFLKGGWYNDYNLLCQPVDFDPDPSGKGMLMVQTCYICCLSKLLDLLDTVFFVLRKKDNQITFLHVFHHVSMPIYAWIEVRWVPGGHETFGPLINSFIHFPMYTYYFLSSFGPAMQKYLWWKRYLTQLQMIQFIMVLCKSSLLVFGFADCGYPWQWSAVTAGFMVAFFILFFQFYVEAYLKKGRKNKKVN
uniref:Elongation of very long chain fatty acids protein n=1 Tax=Caligus rogercresseyi TaxID=217165 RepID=C1BRT3_CALRO|nr:Elongation of very long chain fatty acids protein AAEL008004 [Caligus rogercresseyi]